MLKASRAVLMTLSRQNGDMRKQKKAQAGLTNPL